MNRGIAGRDNGARTSCVRRLGIYPHVVKGLDKAVPEAVPEAVSSRGCEATTADGKPCRAAPMSGSTFCLAHSGRDMAELGRRGGLVRRRRGRGGGHRSDSAGLSPHSPQRDDGGPSEHGSHGLSGADSFSARERLRWEAANSPSATARVSAARALLDEEPRPEVSEPEVSGVPQRGVDLVDVLAVAAASGMDLDALVAAAKARASLVGSS